MEKIWEDYELPTQVNIDGEIFKIRSDYRAILDIIMAFNDPDLIDKDKILVALEIFYIDYKNIKNYEKSFEILKLFIDGNKTYKKESPKLMDWEQDLSLIIPPVNKVLGEEIRQKEYLHWWTFLGAYMEIGECTFNTFVSIRDKKRLEKKLDKIEEKIYRENREQIDLKPKYDKETQREIDIIMGRI